MSDIFQKKAAPMGAGCASIFGGVFILAGLAIGFFAYFPAVLGWWQTQAWVEVPCWIEKVEMNESDDSDGSTTYSVKAQYRYEFEGRKHQGDRVGLVSGGDNMGDFQQRVYDELSHHEGQDRPFRCFVNPGKPGESLLYPELRWGLLLMMSLFPTLFPLAGGVVAVGGVLAARKHRREAVRSQRMPDEPWRWRDAWAGKEVTQENDGLITFAAVASWILLVQMPLTSAVVVSGAFSESWKAWLALLPLVLAWIPLKAVWRRLKARQTLGSVTLQLKHWPLKPGEALEGRLCFSRMLSPRLMLQVKARCQTSVTYGTGENAATSQETLWQEVQLLSAAEAHREGAGCAVDLRLDLSANAPGTADEVAGQQIRYFWQLEVLTDPTLPPVLMPLPVFGGSQRAERPHQPAELLKVESAQLTERLSAAGIQAHFRADGTPEKVLCMPRRNRFLAIILLAFGGIWMSIFFFLLNSNAPMFFKVIWGITAPLIELCGLRLLLHTRQLETSEDQLRLVEATGPFFIRKTTLQARDLLRLSYKATSHATYLNRQVTYYCVQAEELTGKKWTLVDGLTEDQLAQELVMRLETWRKKALK